MKRTAAMLGVLVFALLAGPVSGQQRPPARCSTFDAESEPSSTFRAGDRILIRGAGFGASSVVLVSFLQNTRTVELERIRTDRQGAFVTREATIPQTVESGTVSIRALDARGSATCTITVRAANPGDEGLRTLYVVWGAILAAFALFLAVLTYRRWKAERLRRAVADLRIPRDDEDDDGDGAWAPDPSERSAVTRLADAPVLPPVPPADPGAMGRPRTARRPSEAIERLRREVQTWRS